MEETKQKGGDVANRDDNGGAESLEKGERAIEYEVERESRQNDDTSAHMVRTAAIWVTPERGTKSPDSDYANWGYLSKSNVISHACNNNITRLLASLMERVGDTTKRTLTKRAWPLASKEPTRGSAVRAYLLETR